MRMLREQALLERIRSVIGDAHQRIVQVRERMKKQVPFVALGNQLYRDLLRVRNTDFESSPARYAQQQLVASLTHSLQQLELNVAAAARQDPEGVFLHGLIARIEQTVGLIAQNSNGGRTEEEA